MSRVEIWESKLAEMSSEVIERKLRMRRISDWKALLAREELERRAQADRAAAAEDAQEEEEEEAAPPSAAPAAERPVPEPSASVLFMARSRPARARPRLPVVPIIVVLATLAAALAMVAPWPR